MNHRIFCMAALLGLAGGASAQQAPAQRYIDDQGVEIIQNRDTTRPADTPRAAPAKAQRGVITTTGSAGSTNAAGASTPPKDAKLQVSPAEQAERDRDREAILKEELGQEMRKYEAATKALAEAEKAARGHPMISDTLKPLREALHTRQQNIQSISAELQRTRTAR